MAVYSYRTISKSAVGQYKDKGSRFLAFAYPVDSQIAIKDCLTSLKKEYFDARHHCFAWILDPEKKTFRAFDDGEPNHSAGDPILGQIRSKDLTNVLLVVVRYFGGVKLGVGGLISAYKSAAEDALRHAEIIEKEIVETITLSYDYPATPEVMRLVKAFDLVIRSQTFEVDCTMTAEYKLRNKQKIFETLALMKAMGTRLGVA